jgi:hypothetical protein
MVAPRPTGAGAGQNCRPRTNRVDPLVVPPRNSGGFTTLTRRASAGGRLDYFFLGCQSLANRFA